jgi:hypothetical protein
VSEVFVKTRKGIEEIENLHSALSLRVRRILIQVDGIRSVEDIRALSLAENLDQILDQLRENEYISPVTNSSVSGSKSAPVQTLSFREIPSPPDPKAIGRAKTFMINTLRVFCGEWAHLTIIQAVSDANTHEELRKSFTPWLEAISATKDGQRRIVELSSSLLKDI